MSDQQDRKEHRRMAANLCQAIELTEMGLDLRLAMLRQQRQADASMKDVMHQIRLVKEQAWPQNRS
jgi:hypothetical protein